MFGYFGANAIPGLYAARETQSNEYTWTRFEQRRFRAVKISSTARDTGNTGLTTQLRNGLAMGKITSTGEYAQFDYTASDGTNRFDGFLCGAVKMIDVDGNAVDQMGLLLVGGAGIKALNVYTGNSPYTINSVLRAQSNGRFQFDDDLSGASADAYPWPIQITKTANYTIVAADNGARFDNTGDTGAIVFTLPTLAPGLVFGFLVVEDFSFTVASAAGDDMIVPNDNAADSVAFSTAGDIVGGQLRISSNLAGTKWIVENMSPNAMTIAT